MYIYIYVSVDIHIYICIMLYLSLVKRLFTCMAAADCTGEFPHSLQVSNISMHPVLQLKLHHVVLLIVWVSNPKVRYLL